MPVQASAPVNNRLLGGLSGAARRRLMAMVEPVELVFGDILCEADQTIDHVYFPLNSFISLMVGVEHRAPLEMGLIGNEGMLGATLNLGIKTAPMRAIVQGAGVALRMKSAQLLREAQAGGSLFRAMNRYLYVLIAQMAQSLACTRFHEIEPRLARWLLMTHDRAHADHFYLTHEYLADMLGVRRSGISIAAENLKSRKLIHYSRGEIRILDRRGLEAVSCVCYGAMVEDYINLFA